MLSDTVDFDFTVYQCDCEKCQTFIKVAGADMYSFCVLAWFGNRFIERFELCCKVVDYLVVALRVCFLQQFQLGFLFAKLFF